MPSTIATVPANSRGPASARLEIAPGTLIKIGVVVALVWAVFGQSLIGMAEDWWNMPTNSQGMLLPPLALYIAWLGRHTTLRYPAMADLRGLIVIAAGCLTFLLGKVASEFFFMRVAFVILLAGLIWTFWGTRRLRTLTFPMLLLATMVPPPAIVYNSLAAPLQLFASDIATRIAQLCGVSVLRDGNILHLAGGSLGVAEACSGLGSLTSLVVGSILLGFLVCSGPVSRIVLFLSSIPIAIAINVFRVAGTAILADYNQELAMGFYHSLSGWLVFLGGFAVLYVTALLLHVILDRK
jgi:exosortase